jgi:hypothetical protein
MKISNFNIYSTENVSKLPSYYCMCKEKEKNLAACCNNQDETNTNRELSCDIYFAG